MHLRFSQDGRRFLTLESPTGTVEVYDAAAAGKPLFVINEPAANAHFSPSDDRILLIGSTGEVRLWNPADGKSQSLPLGSGVIDAQFSPDGTRIATAAGNGVQVRDARTFALRGAPWTRAERGLTTNVEWSTDGTRVLVGSRDSLAPSASSSGMPTTYNAAGGAYVLIAPPAHLADGVGAAGAASWRDLLAPQRNETPIAAVASIALALLAGLAAARRAARRLPSHENTAAT